MSKGRAMGTASATPRSATAPANPKIPVKNARLSIDHILFGRQSDPALTSYPASWFRENPPHQSQKSFAVLLTTHLPQRLMGADTFHLRLMGADAAVFFGPAAEQ